MKIIKFLLLSFVLLLNSCASVKFYSDATVKNETGIKVYTSKPYLLVEYNNIQTAQDSKKEKKPSGDSISIKTSVIYLPDLENPQYIKFKSGLGSSDLKLALTNSILTSYGITTDTKIPETITAVAGLVTGLTNIADISKAKNGENSIIKKKVEKPVFELYDIIIKSNVTSLEKVEIK